MRVRSEDPEGRLIVDKEDEPAVGERRVRGQKGQHGEKLQRVNLSCSRDEGLDEVAGWSAHAPDDEAGPTNEPA